MNKTKKTKVLEWIILLIFLLGTLIVMRYHELWRDEAQQWLLVKNLSFKDLILHLNVEGHPLIWYVILKGYSLLGLSYSNIGFISWFFTGLAAILLVKKFDFNLITKIVILGSVTFAYICPAISRSYSLLLFEIVLLALLYPKRHKYPIGYNLLLGIIVNTHVLTIGLVGALLVIELYELFIEKIKTRRHDMMVGVGILIVSILILIIQLVNFHPYLTLPPYTIKDFFIQLYYNFSSIFGISTENIILENIILICFVYFIICLIMKKEFKTLWILICSLGFQVLVYTLLYSLSYNMVTIFYAIIILCYMTIKNIQIKKVLPIGIFIAFACTIPYSYTLIKSEINYKYSSAYDTAKYITYNIPEQEKIYCDYPALAASLKPYIDNPLVNAKVSDLETFTYMDWSKYQSKGPITDADLDKIKADGGKYIAIWYDDVFIKEIDKDKYKVLYTSPHSMRDEDFTIIKLNF